MDENFKKRFMETAKSNPQGSVMDLLLSDVLAKHGVSDNALRNLSPERRRKIKQISDELQVELKRILD
ncbi:spore coat protein [Terribacillus saccharophilus]|uniref:spore coat protein n=1 Tax=Terribacillus saccharophilus TaxID=361277 RepID=UPI0039822517